MQSIIIRKWALSWYFLISGRSRPPSDDDRHNVIILRQGFLLAQMNELNQLFRFLTALCGKITGTIWIGYNNLGRMFIFKRATRPNQDIRREFHRSKSSLLHSNKGRKFALYIWLKADVICMPKYTKPPGDHLKGNGDGIRGLSVKLPSGRWFGKIYSVTWKGTKLINGLNESGNGYLGPLQNNQVVVCIKSYLMLCVSNSQTMYVFVCPYCLSERLYSQSK